ncbi:MAG TPA: helix-turn-helix transcriptional regulator [Streptosporangiaceae bacterium]|nr:helix-turn-helix transcriptional regulator [Streptosporangiaceae bacterium]
MALRLGVSSDRQAMEHRISSELTDLITQVTNEIDWLMRENKISRADLASRMGVSPGRVSQVLSGGENLTLRTLASLGAALDAHFEVELRSAAPVMDGTEPTRTEAGHQAPRAEHFEQAARFDPARFGEYSRRR